MCVKDENLMSIVFRICFATLPSHKKIWHIWILKWILIIVFYEMWNRVVCYVHTSVNSRLLLDVNKVAKLASPFQCSWINYTRSLVLSILSRWLIQFCLYFSLTSGIQHVRLKYVYKQNWINHLERMDNTRLPKYALNYKPRGRRDRGRPRKRWQSVDAGTGQTT